MPLANEQTSLITGTGKAETVNNAVKATLKQHQQVFTGNTFGTISLIEISTKLLFQQTVGALDTLFFPQLGSVFGNLDATLTMNPRGVVPPLNSTLVGIAPVPFQEQLHIFPSTLTADGSSISSQRSSSLYG